MLEGGNSPGSKLLPAPAWLLAPPLTADSSLPPPPAVPGGGPANTELGTALGDGAADEEGEEGGMCVKFVRTSVQHGSWASAAER